MQVDAPDRTTPRAEPQRVPAPIAVSIPVVTARQATQLQRLGLLMALLLASYWALTTFASILLPFVVAAGIAYFLDPPTTRLARSGVPRGAAALLMILALVLGGLLFALLLYPLVLAQLGLLLGRAPQYANAVRDWAGELMLALQARLGSEYVDNKLRDLVGLQAGSMLGFAVGALRQIVGGGFALFNVLSLVVVTPVVSFYLLRDWRRAVALVDSWAPRRYAGVLRDQAREVDRILAAWLRGQLLSCAALAVFYAVALSAVGLDLGLVVGLASGFLSFIPYVGSIAGGVASIGLAFAQFPNWNGVAWVGGVYVLGQLLEGYVIYPRFLGDRVELHAVWVIFALFAGGAAFGFLGVLMAVPVAAAIGVLARYWLRRYLTSPVYLDAPPGE